MCGRYRLTNAERFAELNDIRLGGKPIRKRYNIAPSQKVQVVLDESPNEFTEVRCRAWLADERTVAAVWTGAVWWAEGREILPTHWARLAAVGNVFKGDTPTDSTMPDVHAGTGDA